MNKKTKALTTEQYVEIIKTMKEGSSSFRPNERIATALVLEGNLGLRISDILKLRPIDIVRDGDRYRLEITEQKTGKRRVFTVPLVIQQWIGGGLRRQDLGPPCGGTQAPGASDRGPYESRCDPLPHRADRGGGGRGELPVPAAAPSGGAERRTRPGLRLGRPLSDRLCHRKRRIRSAYAASWRKRGGNHYEGR